MKVGSRGIDCAIVREWGVGIFMKSNICLVDCVTLPFGNTIFALLEIINAGNRIINAINNRNHMASK